MLVLEIVAVLLFFFFFVNVCKVERVELAIFGTIIFLPFLALWLNM